MVVAGGVHIRAARALVQAGAVEQHQCGAILWGAAEQACGGPGASGGDVDGAHYRRQWRPRGQAWVGGHEHLHVVAQRA